MSEEWGRYSPIFEGEGVALLEDTIRRMAREDVSRGEDDE